MRYPVLFIGGLALGAILGARAGREPYDQLARRLRRLKDDPATQSAAGLVRARLAAATRPRRRGLAEPPARSIIRLPADDGGAVSLTGHDIGVRSTR